jgi:hypothetical protein
LPLRAQAMTFVGQVTAELAFVGLRPARHAGGSELKQDEDGAAGPTRTPEGDDGVFNGMMLP